MTGTTTKSSRRKQVDLSRYLGASLREEKDFRNAGWALAVSLFLHLALFWLVPWEIAKTPTTDRRLDREVEYVYEEAVPEPEEQRFAETNPDVPSNEPDETNNISNRDQQAAQKEASDTGPENTPFIEGEEEEATKIVEGTLSESQPFPEATAQQESVERQQNQSIPYIPPPQPMAPDFIEQDEVLDEEGIASMLDPPNEGEAEVEDPLRASDVPLTVKLIEQALKPNIEPPSPQPTPAAQPQKPRPRQTVASQVVPGPIMRSSGRAPVMENIAVSAKFSEFGDYLARMFDSIGSQFQILASRSEVVRAEVNSRVVVEFKLTRDGEVDDLRIIITTAGHVATLIGQDSIQSRAPFGPWTEEMLAVLREKETIRITYIYQ